MIKDNDLQISTTIEAEASAWIAQLDGGAMSERDLETFREWCARSPAHAKAVAHAADIWGCADVLMELAQPIRDAKRQDRVFAKRKTRGAIVAGLVAATAVLAVAILGVPGVNSADHHYAGPQEPLLVVTQVGERVERTLSDGSTITLNTDTRLEVDFDDNIRRVRILAGEALFDVAHDEQRPFIVYAEGETVRAVGTQFVVRVTDTSVDVIVTEGVVEYAPVKQLQSVESSRALMPVAATGRLSAGQSIRLGTPDPIITPINRGELRRTLAWTDGVLMFSGETLEEVIVELSRYTDDVVVFDDDVTREIKVGGVFEIGNMDTVWEALETSFDIEVDTAQSGEIHLSTRLD